MGNWRSVRILPVRVTNKNKYAGSQNEKGFTLSEMLLALSCFYLIAFLTLPIYLIISEGNQDIERGLQQMEWEVFCSQIKKELRMSSSVDVLSGKLVLIKGSETIIYERYGANLRRRVNNAGHEILLQNVSAVQFSRSGQEVKVTANGTEGGEYSITIHSFINWEGP